MSAKGVFVTGTDTGVGKSIIAAALARLLRDRGIHVGVMKPVTSGCRDENGRLVSDDAELLAWGAGLPAVDADIAPFLLRQPIAPSEAAYQDGKRVSFRLIGEAFERLAARHDFVIVEGAGGLMVPLDGELLVADLINYLRLPLLVVARPSLGTVNHTLLTCFAARQLGIAVCGVIIHDSPQHPGFAEHTAPQLIGSLAGAPLLGVFPHVATDDTRQIVAGLAARIGRDPATEVLLRGVGAI